METKHRGGAQTAESYKNIPVHAAPGVHQKVVELLRERMPAGARVLDVGAGQGALALRLYDAGFCAIPVDLSDENWMASEISCHVCDLNGDWSDVAKLGPFDAITAIEVIEHLENPRGFLAKLLAAAGGRKCAIIVSTPNPLDTFSCISMFTRGIFNWFSPQHYFGGGHISILPFWLVDKHLEYLNAPVATWTFASPFRHPKWIGRLVYGGINMLRRAVSKGGSTKHFDGETAIMMLEIGSAKEQRVRAQSRS